MLVGQCQVLYRAKGENNTFFSSLEVVKKCVCRRWGGGTFEWEHLEGEFIVFKMERHAEMSSSSGSEI